MLHLTLAGNILRAVGGHPKLYDVDYIPCYPMLMPGRVPKLWLELRRANKRNLQTFIDVCVSFCLKEALLYILTIGQVEKREKPCAKAQPDKYETLAQFYAAIKEGKPLNQNP